MSDAIGVLNASAAVAVGTNIVYTVPAGHAAKVQFMYRGVAGANSTLAVKINGMTIFTTAALTAATVSYSTSTVAHKNDAAASIVGSAVGTTIAPFAQTYMLSADDTVSFVVGTLDFSSMDFQVIGTQVLLPT